MDDPKFWTVAELAVLFRTSKMTVYREIHDGKLAANQIGRSFRVPDAAVSTYLNTPAAPAAPAAQHEGPPCPTTPPAPHSHPAADPART